MGRTSEAKIAAASPGPGVVNMADTSLLGLALPTVKSHADLSLDSHGCSPLHLHSSLVAPGLGTGGDLFPSHPSSQDTNTSQPRSLVGLEVNGDHANSPNVSSNSSCCWGSTASAGLDPMERYYMELDRYELISLALPSCSIGERKLRGTVDASHSVDEYVPGDAASPRLSSADNNLLHRYYTEHHEHEHLAYRLQVAASPITGTVALQQQDIPSVTCPSTSFQARQDVGATPVTLEGSSSISLCSSLWSGSPSVGSERGNENTASHDYTVDDDNGCDQGSKKRKLDIAMDAKEMLETVE